MQLYLRHVILVCLIILGLAPVVAQITINRPEVLMQVHGYAERQKMHRLEREQTILENRLGYLLDLLRMTALLPAPGEILGFRESGPLQPEQARKRFSAVMKQWFMNTQEVWNLRVINLEGVEQLRLQRHPDGFLQPTLLDLENKRSERYMASGKAGYHITNVAANKHFGESYRSEELTLQINFPIRARSVTIGFMVFTIDAMQLFRGYREFSWYSGDGSLIKPATAADEEAERGESAEVGALFRAGRPGLIQPRIYGPGEGWLPVRLDPEGLAKVWIAIPLEADIIESWVGAFNKNTIILFCVILLVVFLVATAITLLIERFIGRLLSSVKSILDERDIRIRFGPFGEMVKLADGLSELAAQHRRDADARAEAEAQLTESRNRIQLLLSSASESIIGADRDGRITFCNPSALKLLGGVKEEQFRGKRFSSLLLAEGEGASIDAFLPGKDLTQHIHQPEVLLRRSDGSGLAVEFWSHPIIRDGEAEGAVFTLVDISVRKQVQEELSRLRVLLSNIVDSMPSALIGVDAELRINQWNRAAEHLFGVAASKAVGQRIDQACHHLVCEIERIHTALRQGHIERSAKIPLLVDGSDRFVDVTAYPLVGEGVGGAVVMVDDVTERMRMEDMMVQSEKMLSVGGLAAGMAHEINNPLAGILQNIQVLRNRLQPDLAANLRVAKDLDVPMERIQAYAQQRGLFAMMDSIGASGRRAAKVVENMLSFSRKSDSSYAPHDLAELLDQAVELAGNDYDLKKKYDFRRVRIERDYAADLPMVACEKGQIQQVILNLLRNGCQAMSACQDGERVQRIVLRLARVGEQVCLQVEDNGPGMGEEVRKRVFEPFFTTKAIGVGTGLGLSVSYFIVTENHAGTMSVESSPENGSCFTVCLPIKKSPAAASHSL